MPKKRANRKIIKNMISWKGKWLISFQWGLKFKSKVEAIDSIIDYIDNYRTHLESLSCTQIPNLHDIALIDGRYSRVAHYWEKDVSEK